MFDGGATNADDGGNASTTNVATAMMQTDDKGKRLLVARAFMVLRIIIIRVIISLVTIPLGIGIGFGLGLAAKKKEGALTRSI